MAAVAVGLLAAIGGAVVFRTDLVRANSEKARISKALRTAGFVPETAKLFESTRIDLLSSNGAQYHIIQALPEFGMRREIRLALFPDEQLDSSVARRISTANGYDIYLLVWEGRPISGGFETYQAFFFPYESIDTRALEGLALPRRRSGGAPGSSHTIAFGAARQQAILGVVVASLVSATASGTSDTFIPQEASGSGEGNTIPRADGADPDPRLDRYRARGELSAADREWWNRHLEEARRDGRNVETSPPLTEAERQRIIEQVREVGRRNYMEMHGVSEDVARQHLGQEPRARLGGRVSGGLAGAQAVGEWTQQVLDHFENEAALQAAEDCHNHPTNPLAIRAQREDRANYDRALDQIRAARASNNSDMFGRALGTGNAVVGTTVMPLAPGIALGMATGAANATLRQLQRERTQQAVAGVTPCDTSTSGGGSASSKGGSAPPKAGQPGGGSTPTGNSTAAATVESSAPTPGPPKFIMPAPSPTVTRPANSAVVRVEALHKWDGLDHHVQYSAVINDLTNLIVLKDGQGKNVQTAAGRDVTVPDSWFRGDGTGSYDEQGTEMDSEQRPCTVSLRGFVTVTVSALPETHTVNVGGSAVVTRAESGWSPCWANTGSGNTAEVGCQFYDVDLEHGGHYVGGEWEAGVRIDAPDGPGYYDRCYLDIGPLKWHDGRPVTGPRTDFTPLATAVARP